MNKWQIICPMVALLVVGLAFGFIALRGQHRGFISVASRSIGDDLIASTNSSHLVRIGPDLKTRLSELLSVRTHIADVLLGDEPAPIGDGTACSRLVLTNDAGRGLLIRLRQAEESGMFHVLGFRSISESL
jgi:hypothetical protein